MTQPAKLLRVVDQAPPKPKTRAQLSRVLAKAMAKEDRLRAQLAAAEADTARTFGQWAAGRSISQDTARRQLESTGLLPERKL